MVVNILAQHRIRDGDKISGGMYRADYIPEDSSDLHDSARRFIYGRYAKGEQPKSDCSRNRAHNIYDVVGSTEKDEKIAIEGRVAFFLFKNNPVQRYSDALRD